MNKHCKACNLEFSSEDRRAKFCSPNCFYEYKRKHKLEYSFGQFRKGHNPWNKNKKGLHLSPNTEYKKERESKNYLPVGTITLRTDRKNGIRKHIKVNKPSEWKYLSLYLWEKSYGEVPKSYVAHHINFDKLDDKLENYRLMSRAEHAKLHRLLGKRIEND